MLVVSASRGCLDRFATFSSRSECTYSSRGRRVSLVNLMSQVQVVLLESFALARQAVILFFHHLEITGCLEFFLAFLLKIVLVTLEGHLR